VPRAPLHVQGATRHAEISRISSAGFTPPSSLLRTHAPIRNPPHASVTPRAQGLCRLLSAPAGSRTFPALSLRIFPHVLGPLPRWLLCCTYPFLHTKQRPSPRKHWLGAIQNTHTAISVWNVFTRLQSFTHVQARGFARHPDCSYRSRSLSRSPTRVRRVRWELHRFRFGPQSDSLSPFQFPATYWAAVAFTSPPISVRYLPEQGIC
jgi:hypothetical protein